MTNLHYQVKVWKGGQITIPHKLRKELDWKEGTILECFKENGHITIRETPEENNQLLKTLQELDKNNNKRKTTIDSVDLIRKDRDHYSSTA